MVPGCLSVPDRPDIREGRKAGPGETSLSHNSRNIRGTVDIPAVLLYSKKTAGYWDFPEVPARLNAAAAAGQAVLREDMRDGFLSAFQNRYCDKNRSGWVNRGHSVDTNGRFGAVGGGLGVFFRIRDRFFQSEPHPVEKPGPGGGQTGGVGFTPVRTV